MSNSPTYFWKKAPFIKLLVAFIAGILIQWYHPLPVAISGFILAVGFAGFCTLFFIPFSQRFRLSFFNGVISFIIFLALGALLAWKKDIRNQFNWFGHWYKPGSTLSVTLEEPPVEKTRSVKANSTINYDVKSDSLFPAKGKIIIYFAKEDTSGIIASLNYGTRIIFKKPLQEIKNAGNPGSFDYKRYALFQGITHQVYLKPGEFEILPGKNKNAFSQFLYSSKERILKIIRNYIPGDKESGLAEALLIGYKHDLDQSLVQSYTNTGVVHIIAISGLHLGLIYWLLAILLKPLQKRRKTKWLRALLIIACLWIFSLLAGAQPSILRSALMFTCIILGESLSRKTSIYNTMAASAFILLCINPYWIWDVGFQLSYAAVLSIVIFMKPIYNCIYVKNKLLDLAWKLNAVTLAAQVLTVPLCIYHFHQFPNLFLLTNFFAVPLSSIILLGEILLCAISFIPALAAPIGKILSWLIQVMNDWVKKIESLPFSVWDGLQISIVQAILLFLFIASLAHWWLEKSFKSLKWGLLALFFFAIIRTGSFLGAGNQQKIIIYNIPQKTAIDVIKGRSYVFIGDSSLLTNNFASNFHLRPSRILHRSKKTEQVESLYSFEKGFCFRGKNILLIDTTIHFGPLPQKLRVDLLVISKNPKLYIRQLARSIDIGQVVFDGSAAAWKMKYWKKDCDSLSIPWHDVIAKGAFVMTLR